MLEALNLHKIYNHKTQALSVLSGVDLKIEKGDFLAIVGPSGAGKSTLLHILGGLDKPSEGKVFFEGKDMYQIGERERANIRNQKIGFVFQFYHLLPEFTALENVMLPGLIKADMGERKDLEAKAMSLLERMGLKLRAQHKPNQLSGGEQQRVAIARSLINTPDIIFCDEPTGNLDSKSGKEVMSLLTELNVGQRQTLVIVTHDEHVAKISKKVIHMQDGKLLN